MGGAAAIVLIVAAVGAFAVWPRGDDATPSSAAEAFLAAWDGGDDGALASLIDDPAALVETTTAVVESLDAERPVHTLGAVTDDGDTATAAASTVVEVRGFGPWTYDITVDLAKVDGDWHVVWAPTIVVPGLTVDGAVGITRTWAERAPILGAGDTPLVEDGPGVVIGLEPRRITDRDEIKAALEQALRISPERVDAALDATGVQPDHFVEITRVPRSVYDPIRPVIYPVPGTVFREIDVRAAPSPTFARHVLGRTGEITAEQLEQMGAPYEVGDVVGQNGIEAQYERQLAGTPTGTIELLGPEDPEVGRSAVETLHTFPGIAPEPVTTTLDVDTQLAAEAALDGVTDRAAIVAVEATGAIRAVVSRPLDEAFNRALSGQYAPGSTFKVVTATSLLQSGFDPETPVPCEPSLVVDGKTFVNFEGGASGTEPFSEAFAESCNTAVISAASGLPEGALVTTATDSYGFNTGYDIGLPSTGGSFPPPEGPVERAASAIGQGKVTVSPMHLASVAAAVAGGTWNPPSLVTAPPRAEQTPPGTPLAPEVRSELDRLMALVVSDGTGAALQGINGVRGKSGTAEYGTDDPPKTNAWFLAYRGDLAISVLVEDGEAGGRVAAPLAATFFTTLG